MSLLHAILTPLSLHQFAFEKERKKERKNWRRISRYMCILCIRFKIQLIIYSSLLLGNIFFCSISQILFFFFFELNKRYERPMDVESLLQARRRGLSSPLTAISIGYGLAITIRCSIKESDRQSK